ncbi:hypothetical protein WA026_015194 [Henosepilachna vigintioctopunctata]|uniref:Uncharacterized protein n=1 Tax=Henosepilachna vigintioctopunctata TaxID=420089 RepID=A0AAW1TNP6_9CUCU
MTSKTLLFCCLAALIYLTESSPVGDVKDIVEDVKNVESHKDVVEVENKVQDQPETVPAAIERIDEDLPATSNDEVGVKIDKGDLDTANTFWGGYYRSPSWGWRRGWGYGGNWGYGGWPYSSYGYGGRGYGGWGWGGHRGWNSGYYWR